MNLPMLPGQKRAQLKRGGYPNQNDAEAALDHVKDLFAILDTDDHAGLADLVALLLERTKNRAPLPDVDEVRRRYTSGRRLSRAMTVGEWLETLAGDPVRAETSSVQVRVMAPGCRCRTSSF